MKNLQHFRQFLLVKDTSPFAISTPISQTTKTPALDHNLLAHGREDALFLFH